MGGQDIIVLAVVAVALAYLARLAWRTFSSPGGCHCGHKPEADESCRVKKLPLVTLEQVGTPSSSKSDARSSTP